MWLAFQNHGDSKISKVMTMEQLEQFKTKKLEIL